MWGGWKIVNFFKKLKALFSGELKEEVIEEGEGPNCYWCDGTIEEHEKLKSFNKRKFHIQCYRIMIKQARKEMGV